MTCGELPEAADATCMTATHRRTHDTHQNLQQGVQKQRTQSGASAGNACVRAGMPCTFTGEKAGRVSF